MKPRRSRRTYRAIIAIAGAVVLPSCDDATDPGLRFAQLDLALEFQYAGAGVPEIGTIRVLLTRTSDASVARDTTIGVPADADSVELTVTVMVRTPDETFTLTLELREPGGAIVFSGGPVIVTPAATSTPPVVVVPIRYVGVGANAAGIEITSSAPSLLAGDTALLSAVARDSGGVAIPGTPIVWRSLDSVQGRVPQPDSGLVIAGALLASRKDRAA